MVVDSDIRNMVEKIKKETEKQNPPVVTLISKRDKNPFKILISTVLSLRTKDEVTYRASERLFEKADTPSRLFETREEDIAGLIYPVGFYRNKAASLKEIARVLIDNFDSRVPSDINQLLKLPNVGRKTANLVLSEGFNIPAICVDTHVHRISNRLGLVSTKTPEVTEVELKKILPTDLWSVYNTYLVGFGQSICTPVSPWCSKCPLNGECPQKGVEKNR